MRDEMLTLPLPPLCQAALAALLEDKRLTETRVVELERRLDQACEAVRDAEDNAESLRVDLDRAETAARKAATDGTAGGTESLPAVDGAIFYSRVSDTRALSSLLLLLLLLLLFLLLLLLLLSYFLIAAFVVRGNTKGSNHSGAANIFLTRCDEGNHPGGVGCNVSRIGYSAGHLSATFVMP